MEDQVTQFSISIQTEPPKTPVLDQAVAYANSNNNNNNNNNAVDVMGGASLDSEAEVGSEQRVKKRRGRPRKYDDVNGSMLSLTSSMPSTHPFGSSVKRSRGRPRGSGNLQILASLGGCVAETAGGSFTPHVITVNTGEDVVSRILAFSQKGPRAVCILSATGAVSSVLIRKPGSSTDTMRREGCFEVLSLSGSYTFVADGDAHRKKGFLSVSLAEPDGRVFGGVLEGSLVAAGPIQLIVASFKQNISKEIMRRHSAGSSAAPNMSSNPDLERFPPKVPKIIEGERSCPSPTSGLMPTTNRLPENVIPATTTEVSDNAIPSNQNMPSASINGVVGLDCQVLQPDTDRRISAHDDASA